MRDTDLLHELVNKQFEIIGVDTTLEELEKNGNMVVIQEGKKEKKIEWWHYYHFDSWMEYDKWIDWCTKQLAEVYEPEVLKLELNFLDLAYGLKVRIKKEVA
jgi:hypothetical protein